MKEINIAILLTCFNRKEKTINALYSLYESLDYINEMERYSVKVAIFLTNDGCTDGTPEEVARQFFDKTITIINADGNAYWAGGMRMAWKEAIKGLFDFYLLINDDTTLKRDCLCELLETHNYALEHFGKSGVYTGFVSSIKDEKDITYGAKRYYKSFLSKAETLNPTGIPQKCTMVNANILLVSKEVVDTLGILDEAYVHAAADMDYGIKASKKGFPVLTTSKVCGYCENDHDNSDNERDKVLKMSLKERKEFIDRPNIKQYHDSLIFYWRYDKLRYFIFKISYFLNLFFPSVYYKLYKKRNH